MTHLVCGHTTVVYLLGQWFKETEELISELSFYYFVWQEKLTREEPRWQSKRTCSHSLLREHQNHN